MHLQSSTTNLQQASTSTQQPQIQQGPNPGFSDEYYVAPTEYNDMGQSEHYIYVTYPPELKRRLLERYGKEIYLMLLKKDEHEEHLES